MHCADIIECEGHFGKHGNCLTQALHEAAGSMQGWAEEESGDVDSPYGFRWLIIANESIAITPDYWSADFTLNVAAGQYFIITENDRGFVRLFSFDSEADARADWDLFMCAYGEWLGDDDE